MLRGKTAALHVSCDRRPERLAPGRTRHTLSAFDAETREHGTEMFSFHHAGFRFHSRMRWFSKVLLSPAALFSERRDSLCFTLRGSLDVVEYITTVDVSN